MKKFNLKKIMTDAHILFRALKERGISFGECLKWKIQRNCPPVSNVNCPPVSFFSNDKTSLPKCSVRYSMLGLLFKFPCKYSDFIFYIAAF